MAKFKAGTPVTDNPKRTHLTQEQWAALEKSLDPNAPVRAAKAELVNHFILPDGSIVAGDEHQGDTLSLMQKRHEEATVAAHAALDSESADPVETQRLLESATRARFRVAEVKDHFEQGRFLIAVDEEGEPVTYFQCAVPGNPDVFPQEPANDA
jgi:hypothetical protein